MAAAKKTTAAKKSVTEEVVEAVAETPEAVEPEVVEPVVESEVEAVEPETVVEVPIAEAAPALDVDQSPEAVLIADLKAQIKYWEQVIKDKS